MGTGPQCGERQMRQQSVKESLPEYPGGESVFCRHLMNCIKRGQDTKPKIHCTVHGESVKSSRVDQSIRIESRQEVLLGLTKYFDTKHGSVICLRESGIW